VNATYFRSFENSDGKDYVCSLIFKISRDNDVYDREVESLGYV